MYDNQAKDVTIVPMTASLYGGRGSTYQTFPLFLANPMPPVFVHHQNSDVIKLKCLPLHNHATCKKWRCAPAKH